MKVKIENGQIITENEPEGFELDEERAARVAKRFLQIGYTNSAKKALELAVNGQLGQFVRKEVG